MEGLIRSTDDRFVFISVHIVVDVYVGERLQNALQRLTNLDPALIGVTSSHLH